MIALSQRESDHVLRIRGLRKDLVSGGSRFTIEVPLLNLERGKFYGLIGRSGSGKSTMLDLLAMVSRPTGVESFELFVDGTAINLAELVHSDNDQAISGVRLRHFGYILQSGGLLPFLTVRENLNLPLLLSGRSADDRQMQEMIELFDMGPHLDKKPSGLSGGQRQRVSIMRALALKPEMVLADEPTAAVDENLAVRIVGELKRLATGYGVTVVMVSHDIELVTAFSDHNITFRPQMVNTNTTLTVVALED